MVLKEKITKNITETAWLTKPKIFTLWFFIENFANPQHFIKIDRFSHTMKFIILKVYNSVGFSIYRVAQSLSLSNSRKLLSPQKETLHLLAVISPNLPRLSSYRQILLYFLFIWICLFGTFHINCSIQYIPFCAWLVSLSIPFLRFIHIVA